MVWVHEDELERYGRHSLFVPRELYRMGPARLDALPQQRFGSAFADATEEEQDGPGVDVAATARSSSPPDSRRVITLRG